MQNKGAIKALAIVFGIIFLYQLSFTVVTKVTEGKAARYAKGDATKEKFYLDSITRKQKEKLADNSFGWLVKNHTYSRAKEREINLGLDLKGGMNLTLEVSVKDVVIALADNAEDPSFQEAIKLATERQKKSNSDFVTLFGEAYEEVNPNGSLAAIFSYGLKEKGINNESSNSEVLEKLRKECDDAYGRAFQILKNRIDRFGVAQPTIQKMEGSGRILVELPGVKDPERVRNLLRRTAQLEFWETYSFDNEVYQYFLEANKAIAQKKAGQATGEETVTEETIAEGTEVEETEGEEIAEEKTDVDTTDQGGLLNQISQDETQPENLQNNEELAKYYAENPLNEFLIFSGTEGLPMGTARVGIALESDMDTINKMLESIKDKDIFPRDMKLAWSAKPEKFGKEEFYELIALKMTNNGCALGGGCITDARQDFGMQNAVEVDIQMDKEGSKEWERITGSNIGKQIAIVLDDNVYSYPVVNQKISGGRSQISGGGMDIEEGQDLANILKAGQLPARINIASDEVVGPSLGKESVRKGMWSMIFAFILVLVYMVFFYKKAGWVADIALVVNVFFLFGVLACLGSVLTLPGIAGIVLTLGMAVDSNVIIFERIKEELRGGKGLRAAIDAGYKNAYSAIIDGNVTTLITGIVLIVLGSGPVHSFAVTLCIGILTSLFTSIFISRLIFTRMLDKEKNITFTTKMTENFLKDKHFDFIKFRKVAYIIALVMIVISVGSLCFKGLNLGIDFKGGRNYIVRFDSDVDIKEVRNALATVTVEDWEKPEVKTYGPNGQFKITTKYKIEDEDPNVDAEIQTLLHGALKGLYKQDISLEKFSTEDQIIDKNNQKQVGILSSQKVGGTIASDITTRSIWAIAISLLLMFAYIAIRFRKWQYGLSALAALTHDTVIMLGMYSLFFNVLPFTMEVDQAFIAAVLTIIGYSINATVVIFDRVRENTNLHPKATWRENINNAVNSTLTRSFNTSGSTFIVLLAIFIFGGDTIRGFIFALLVGILAGTFSSVFLSSPIAYNLIGGNKQEKALTEADEKEDKKK